MALDPFIKIRRDLHQIPELGFQEFKTQKYILAYLAKLPSDRLEIRTWRTGIVVRIRGNKGSKTIGYRTDMDGLPIKEETNMLFSSLHEGNMHACGHDLHMSIALGVLTHFIHNPIDHHLVFIFQPAEEGPGGAEPLLNSGVLQGWMPDLILALHIAPEYPVGTIAVKPGRLFANTSDLFIKLKGKGGHAAFPHQANDMVVAACSLVSQIQTIVARNVDPMDSAVITIGKITAGTVENIIAESAFIEGTIRTLSIETMDMIKARIKSLVEAIEIGYHCDSAIDFGAFYYQVDNDVELTLEFMDFLNKFPDISVVECKEAMTGEDFGHMLKEIPGFMFWLGVESEYGLHHAKLKPNEAAIGKGIDAVIRFIEFKGKE